MSYIQPYTKNLNNIIAKNKVIDSIVIKQLSPIYYL